MLKIENLYAETLGKEILKGVNLNINPGEIHAIMGPNGSGKSTLSKVIAGAPEYIITKGDILLESNFKNISLLEKEPSERALLGIFLGFQHPVEIPGLSNFSFLKAAFDEVCKSKGVKTDILQFKNLLEEKMKFLNISPDFIERNVNTDFSGGEKKRNEILQMALLNPKISFLDEIDSGLDVDSLRIVANAIKELSNKNNSTVLITHYQRILEYIIPDFVHIMYEGKIIKSGGKELALEIEKKGYDWLIE